MQEGANESPHDEGLRDFYREEEAREAALRRFIYHDVEVLVTTGYLQHTIEVLGVPITFRSMPQDGWARIQNQTDANTWFLTHSVSMVDGIRVSEDPNASHVLYHRLFSKLPSGLVQSLCSIPNGLNRRIDRALRVAEAFVYEPYGKQVLLTAKRCEENTVRMICDLVLNADETRDREQAEWAHTLFISAAMAGSKAVQSAETSLKNNRRKERQRQQKVIEDAVNFTIGSDYETPALVVEFDGKTFEVPRVLSPSTEADLFGEMDRVMSSSRDYHDEVVAKYKAGIRERIEADREATRAILAQASSLVEQEQTSDRPALVGYTPDQLLSLRPEANTPARPKVADSSHAGRLYERYLSDEAKIGWIGAQGTPEAAVLDNTATTSLQDRLESRRPTLK